MTHQRSRRSIRFSQLISATSLRATSTHAASFYAALPLALCAACSSGDVNLGDGLVTQDFRRPSRCAESVRIEGDVFIENQRQLEELAGCEEIDGNLTLTVFEDADLAPLASLRRVTRQLGFGSGPLVYPTDPEEEAALLALENEGIIDSLHGLEALESVGTLNLRSLRIEDLTPLESLRRIDDGLFTYHLPNLTSLAGIEQAPLNYLWLSDNPALTSLDGVTFKDDVNNIAIEFLTALTDIEAIAQVEYVNGRFILSGTGLETLPPLALSQASYLSVDNNAQLVDASGLAALAFVTQLNINANPVIEAFPALPNLEQIDELSVIGNGLESLAFDFPSLRPGLAAFDNRNVELYTTLLEVGYNPNLTQVTIPAGFESVQYFTIHDNESLTSVDLGTLKDAELLLITSNPVLSTIDKGALETVDSLEVTDNPALVDPAAAFEGVRTFETLFVEDPSRDI